MVKDITWEVTSKERRGQVQAFISRTWLLFVLLVIIVPFFSTNTFFELRFWGIGQFLHTVGYSILGVALVLAGFFFLNKILRYRDRKYALNDEGIEISVGEKHKKFSWSDFEYFYAYSARGQHSSRSGTGNILQGTREQIGSVAQGIEGGIFYLQKRSGGILGFGKVFVVVHAEPDNTGIVSRFLQQKLPEKQMTAGSDLGLVFYEFK